MIVHFPDKDFPYDVTILFDTEAGVARYQYSSDMIIDCSLTRSEWVDRLREWRIDLQRLMEEQGDYAIDVGL